MFTQNMNRILTNDQTKTEDNDNRSPSITQLIKEMNELPADHPVWRYMNPTATYCQIHGIYTRDINGPHQFITWYDTHIHVMYEMKERRMEPHQEAQVDAPQASGSTSSAQITWGQTRPRNHEEELKQWNESSSCVTDGDAEGDKGDTTIQPIPPKDAGVITYSANNTKAAYAKEEREDEIEFTRIPIAGEDSEDYEDDDEIAEEEDEALILLQQTHSGDEPLVETSPATSYNATTVVTIDEPPALTAEDIAYMIGHVDGVVKSKDLHHSVNTEISTQD